MPRVRRGSEHHRIADCELCPACAAGTVDPGRHTRNDTAPVRSRQSNRHHCLGGAAARANWPGRIVHRHGGVADNQISTITHAGREVGDSADIARLRRNPPAIDLDQLRNVGTPCHLAGNIMRVRRMDVRPKSTENNLFGGIWRWKGSQRWGNCDPHQFAFEPAARKSCQRRYHDQRAQRQPDIASLHIHHTPETSLGLPVRYIRKR